MTLRKSNDRAHCVRPLPRTHHGCMSFPTSSHDGFATLARAVRSGIFCNSRNDTHARFRTCAFGELTAKKSVSCSSLCLRRGLHCVQYSGDRRPMPEKPAGSFCRRQTSSNNPNKIKSKGRTEMSAASTVIEFSSSIPRGLHGRRKPKAILHTCCASIRAHAAAGSLATTNRRPRLSESFSRKSCGALTSAARLTFLFLFFASCAPTDRGNAGVSHGARRQYRHKAGCGSVVR